MTALLPLIMLWLATRTAPAAAPQARRKTAPRWPTPASPPPMPAFQAAPKPKPSADPSGSSTPLADLHNAPPKLAPASTAEPAAVKAKAIAAFKKKSTSLLQQRLSSPFGSSATTVPVASLQQILIKRGVKIAPDGLYGPRTAAAWAKLATSRLLPPTITRVGPKSAKVVARTYDTLSVPAIP